MLFCPLANVKMPTIVGILTFMSRKKFILSLLDKSFITSGSDLHFILSRLHCRCTKLVSCINLWEKVILIRAFYRQYRMIMLPFFVCYVLYSPTYTGNY